MPPVVDAAWVGRRVSLRRFVERDRFADVVGDLVGLDAVTAVIETRTGLVEVPLATVAFARLVEPSTADILALEAICAQGWQPADTEPLGGWTLRADGGFSGRANSVLPLRPAGQPVADALAAAGDWYADRDLPLMLQLPLQARSLLDSELGERGFTARGADTAVLVKRLDGAPFVQPTWGARLHLEDDPDSTWLSLFRDGGVGAGVVALLRRHDRVVFASVRVQGTVAAVGRGVIDEGWLGVTAVQVSPEFRRRGLATSLMRELELWARQHGARRAYLQVTMDNAAALSLYRDLGYWHHHEYRYRVAPTLEA